VACLGAALVAGSVPSFRIGVDPGFVNMPSIDSFLSVGVHNGSIARDRYLMLVETAVRYTKPKEMGLFMLRAHRRAV
jgi:hypothetical protein